MSVTITDLFCGAGGSSVGAGMAGCTLRLGVNHWPRAIETHATNFQYADHACENVSTLTTGQIRRFPDSDILLASPECTNHSLAKGAQRRKPQAASLFDDGPAGEDEQDRSRATMWDVVRFAEQKLLKGKPYKAIVVENVVDAFKWGAGDDGGLFDAWLLAVRALGYEHEIVWANSMFVPPTPQSRDRMYVVFWQRGMRRPKLRVEPPAWCPACARVVAGRQTWKRVGSRPWGRYGQQYLYSCPECSATVYPGAMPASTAIDWALPVECIGARTRPLAPATRQRIRRGLQRLADEPFALGRGRGSNPRPLTLPLVGRDRDYRHAMVMPVAGNTFERTPGNRARQAAYQPADTVHGTLDRAIVIPPMGQVAARDADRAPVPTQTTTTRSSLVMANTQNGVPRPAQNAPAQTLRTEGGLSMVMANRAHTLGRDATLEPTHPVLTGGHLAAVVAPAQPTGGQRDDAAAGAGLSVRDGQLGLLIPDASIGYDQPSDPSDSCEVRSLWSDQDIDSCGFRMFVLDEIARTMAMDTHIDGSPYIVCGNKRERMAQYGNAVTPPVMWLLVSRLLRVL